MKNKHRIDTDCVQIPVSFRAFEFEFGALPEPGEDVDDYLLRYRDQSVPVRVDIRHAEVFPEDNGSD